MSIGDRDGSGGKITPRDVMNYSPPQGPKGMMHQGPGLGGSNFGNCQCMDGAKPQSSGSAGIGGSRHGNSPTQRG